MMHRLAVRNILRSPVMSLLSIVQMYILFLVAIGMTSSVLSRFSYYTPLKRLLNSDGEYYFFYYAFDPETGIAGTTTEQLAAQLQGDPQIAASYLAWLYDPEIDNQESPVFISMDDMWLETFTPELEAGSWFSLNSWDKATVPIVVTQNDFGFAVGDIVELRSFGTEQPVSCEIIGILQEGARILGYTLPGEQDVTCKNLYQNYYYSVEKIPLIFLPQSFLDTTVINTQLHGPLALTYPTGTEERIRAENSTFLNRMTLLCVMDCQTLRKNSMTYIFAQCKTLLPIIIAVLILTLVSTMSVNALSVKRQLRHYAIYAICGLQWKKCIYINLLSSLYLSLVPLLLALCSLQVLRGTTLLRESVIQIGAVQILVCLMIIVIYVAFSVVLPIRMIHGSTPNQILRSN